MANSPNILERLCRETNEVVDVALAEALSTADPGSRETIAVRLLERKRPAGLTGLIRHFADLPTVITRRIVAQITDFHAALRAAGNEGDVELRLGVVEIVDHARETRLGDVLARQLHSEDSRLTRAAARALLRQARRVALGEHDIAKPQAAKAESLTPFDSAHGKQGERGLNAKPQAASPGTRTPALLPQAATQTSDRQFVMGAVTEACACFHQHRRHDVLIAALCFVPRMGPVLVRHVTDRRGAAHHAMCEVVGQADHPLVCRALLGLGLVETMHESVVRGLSRPHVGGYMSHVLHDGWLLAMPAVRATVRRVRASGHLLPTGRRLAAMPIPIARQLPRWIDALNVEPGAKIAALNELSGRRDATVRLLALRELMRFSQAEADEVAAAMCFDAEPAIARIALRHLIRRRWSGLSRLMVRLIGADAHGAPGLRELAERYLGPVGFEKFWANWHQLSASARLAGGRALMKIDGRFNHKLHHKTQSASADERLQAVMMIRQLGQETYFETRLLELSRDEDARVASSAVKAICELGDSPHTVHALSEALDHADDRVRSNAIESLEAIKGLNHVQGKLERIAEGHGNRSRATAIKALMGLPMSEAMPRLRKMLTDAQDTHRVSALWVVERLGLGALVHSVAELARQDADPRVRRRAVRVVRELAEAHGRKQAG